MAVPRIVIDGAAPYGTPNSGVITINSVVYVLEDITVDRPTDDALQRDGGGIPVRQRLTAGVATMTATLQITASTPYPKFGDTFVLTVDSNYGSETWIVQNQNFEASNSESEMRTAPLSARKALNPSDITLVN